MGVLNPGSAHARPSAQPHIDTRRNFLADMSGRGGGNLKKITINFLAISGDSKHFSFFYGYVTFLYPSLLAKRDCGIAFHILAVGPRDLYHRHSNSASRSDIIVCIVIIFIL